MGHTTQEKPQPLLVGLSRVARELCIDPKTAKRWAADGRLAELGLPVRTGNQSGAPMVASADLARVRASLTA